MVKRVYISKRSFYPKRDSKRIFKIYLGIVVLIYTSKQIKFKNASLLDILSQHLNQKPEPDYEVDFAYETGETNTNKNDLALNLDFEHVDKFGPFPSNRSEEQVHDLEDLKPLENQLSEQKELAIDTGIRFDRKKRAACADSENCPIPDPEQISVSFYKTDPDRYLITILKWGPNNQVLGFYEAMEISKILNRTLVYVPMFKHKTDVQNSKDFIDYKIRLNTAGISNFISTKDWTEISSECSKPTAVFLPQWVPPTGSVISRILEFERATNYQILDPRFIKHPKARQLKFRKGVKIYPDNNLLYKMKQSLGVEKVAEMVRSNFTELYTEEKCAILVEPYKILKPFKPNAVAKRSGAYSFPTYIEKMARRFLLHHGAEKDAEDENFLKLGLHWRYNKGDWSNRCQSTSRGSSDDKTELRHEQCNILHEINGSYVGNAVTNWWKLMIRQDPDLAQDEIPVIYLAAPPDDSDLVENFVTELTKKFLVLTNLDLHAWILDTYSSDCCILYDNFQEIVSLVEQVLMKNSAVFISWPSSSWSGRVNLLRSATLSGQFQTSIFDIIAIEKNKLKK